MGGKFHLKLNIGERPIANKYREGKMKRTLKRQLKVLEIAEREAIATSVGGLHLAGPGRLVLLCSAQAGAVVAGVLGQACVGMPCQGRFLWRGRRVGARWPGCSQS